MAKVKYMGGNSGVAQALCQLLRHQEDKLVVEF